MSMKVFSILLLCVGLSFAGNFQRESTKETRRVREVEHVIDTVYVETEKPVYKYMYYDYSIRDGSTSRQRVGIVYKRTAPTHCVNVNCPTNKSTKTQETTKYHHHSSKKEEKHHH